MPSMRARLISLAIPICAVLCGACGEDGKPRPGSSDPCDTPIAGVLGCRADRDPLLAGDTFPIDAATEACGKLVACGILASEYFSATGTECQLKADCGSGECLPNHEGAFRCHYHRLDFFWCVERINERRTNRCDNEDPFTTEEVDAIVRCIERTQCAALGLPFSVKQSDQEAGALDAFVCNDGETRVFTATVCDHGLLEYR